MIIFFKKFFSIICNFKSVYIFIKSLKIKCQSQVNSIVLIEFSSNFEYILSNFLFLKNLSQIDTYKFVFYFNNFNFSFKQKIYVKLKYIYNFIFILIYKICGIKKILIPTVRNSEHNLGKKIFNLKIKKIKTKQDLLNLKIDNIWIGDLVYDYYLKKNKKFTVDIESKVFKVFLYDFILLFIFWKNYIYSKKVKNIFVTHTIYHHGIPLRIAVSLGIKVFQVNLKFAYQLNKKNIFAYTEFKNYKKIFNQKKHYYKNVKLISKKKLELKLKGDLIEVDYVKKSSYGRIDKNLVLNKNNKIKILIAPHCLFDNPHSFGLHIFEDYMEWLLELAHISEKLNYEWYIKNHPTVNPINFKFAKDLSNKYKNIFYIDHNVNHNQIIQEGIDYCLTMYGNITLEYAYFKIPVIVASKNQPYCNYNFYTYPKTKKNYLNLFKNIKKINNKRIIKDEIYEAYYMKYIYGLQNWFFKEKIGLPEDLRNKSLDTAKIFSYISNGLSRKNLNEEIKKFILSKKYRLGF